MNDTTISEIVDRLTESHFEGGRLRAEVFITRYALRDKEGRLLETEPEQMWRRVAHTIAAVEKDPQTWERRFFHLLENFRFLPGGRILFGCANPRKSTLFNCYFIPIQSDSIRGINRWMDQAARTYQKGGGVGTNLDVLRPRGTPISGAGLYSSGAVSFMELFSTLTGVMGASSGRRGALMISMGVEHPDILEFITAKADLEKTRIRNANISVRLPDSFLRAVYENSNVDLNFHSRKVKVSQTVPARKIWEKLIQSAWSNGEPGVLFWDRIKEGSTTEYNGMEVQGVNVCGEVPMEPYGACNLGSINLSQFVRSPFQPNAHFDFHSLENCVSEAVRFLDDVIIAGAPYHPLPQQRRESLRTGRVGLGVLGLADALIQLNIRYGSPESMQFVDQLFRTFKEAAYAASIDLAREKGVFPAFDRDQHQKAKFIQSLPPELCNALYKDGIRNCALLSIAPTGSISLLAGCSSGIEPVFAEKYKRLVGGKSCVVEHPLLVKYRKEFKDPRGFPRTFCTAYQIEPSLRVALQAAIQRHLDQSISSTVNLPMQADTSMVENIYRQAWIDGCKGITVFREGSRPPVVEPAEEDAPLPVSPTGICVFCETS